MHQIRVKADDLDEQNRRFAQVPLRQPVFLNSVPKSGSHLLRNIVRMFVPVPQHYQRDFIQHGTLVQHLAAFDARANLLSWGHLFFSDAAAIELAHVRKLLIVRDPYGWVMAKLRFMMSGEFTGKLDYLKTADIGIDQLVSLVIFGIPNKDPGLFATFTHNAVAWFGSDVHLVRYEELVAMAGDPHREAADAYFADLLDACGIHRPDDWRERVRIGADRKRSGTARENLSIGTRAIPDELNEMQRRIVDYAAPGLRAILGYA